MIPSLLQSLKKIGLGLALLVVITGNVFGANRYSVASGNWNSTSTWASSSGGTAGASVPGANDNVIIEDNNDVTVTANAVCNNLTVNGTFNNQTTLLKVNAGFILAVNGSFSISGGNGNRVAGLTVDGTIKFAGTLTLGTINTAYNLGTNSTIEYNGASQTVTNIFGAYNNLTLSGSGIKTISSGTLVNGNFLINGSASVTLTSSLNVLGSTIISGTGILTLGATNVLSSTSIILDGGTFRTGATTGYTETVGTLNLAANSTLALGTGNRTLTFANSSGVTWSGTSLTITGWTGTAGSSGTAGKIVVGAGGLSSSQLDLITFDGYDSGAEIVGGELVPKAKPLITVGTLTAYSNQCINTASTEKNYTVSGTNLNADIIITPPVGFEISKTSGSGFVANPSTLTLTPSGGTVSSTTIYVRFIPTEVQTYSANMTHESTGATQKNVVVSGSGVNTAPAISTPTSSNSTSTSADLGGNITSIGCSQVTERGIYWSTTSGFADGTGTKVAETGTFNIGTFSVLVTGLEQNKTYYFKAFATNDGGTSYTTQGSFTTGCSVSGDPAVFGDGVWNVYAYNGDDMDLNPANVTYRGYYTESNLNFDSRNRWGDSASPSSASGYQGCTVDVDYHTFVYKRQNFLCGSYQIDVLGTVTNTNGHDDAAQLYVNGNLVWEHVGCCDSHSNVWSGLLDESSTVEFRVEEQGGLSYGALKLTRTELATASPVISSPICSGSNTVSGTVTASNGTIIELFKDGTYIGTTSVNSNAWTLTGLSPLTDGDVLTATATESGKCVSNESSSITVTALPATPTANNNGPLCEGSTLNLTTDLVSGATYLWTGPNGFTSSLQNPTISNTIASQSGTYSVIVTVGSCSSLAGTTNVEIKASLSAPTSVTPSSASSVCVGGSINLRATSVGNTIYWYTQESGGTSIGYSVSGADFSVSPVVNTTYYAEAQSPEGCISSSRTATGLITITTALSGVTLSSATQQDICIDGIGTQLSLIETDGGIITSRQWGKRSVSGGSISEISSATESTYTPNGADLGAGTWYLVCTSTPTCGSSMISNEVMVVVSESVGGTLSGGVSPSCIGSTTGLLTLTGYIGSIVRWERKVNSGSWESLGNAGNSTFTDNNSFYAAGTVKYRVVVKNESCAEAYSTEVSIDVDAASVGGWISYVDPICEGSSVTLNLNGSVGNVVRWEKHLGAGEWVAVSGTSISLIDTPSSGGSWEYRAVVKSGSCPEANSTPITVTVNPTLGITLGANPEICVTTTSALIPFTATAGAPEGWVLTFNGAAISAGFSSPQNGSIGATSGNITVNVPYSVSAGVYHANLKVIKYTPACTSVDYPVTITVNANSVASVSIVADQNNVCSGTSVTYTATPVNGGSSPGYQWKVNGNNTGTNNATFTYAPANGDVITCELTSGLTCVISATVMSNPITMTVVTQPSATSGNDISTCTSSAVNITAGAGATNYSTIVWTSNGSGTFTNANSLTLCEYTPNAADIAKGSIELRLTAKGNGTCTDAISSKILTFNPTPTVYNVTGGGSFCTGGSGVEVGLSGSENGVNYQLFNGTNATGSPVLGTGSAINFGNQTAGTYTVKATNSNTACTQDMGGTITVTDVDKIAPVITKCLSGETVSCVSEIPVGKTSYLGFNEAGGEVTEDCTALNSLTITFADVISHYGECKVTRTYTIKDAFGNPATCTQVFTIDDTKAPVINSVVDIQSAPNDNSCGANLDIVAPTNITENCSLVNEGSNYQYTIGGIPHSGYGSFTALFPEGITAITWTVTDVCGHVSVPMIQTVQVGINLTSISYDNGSTEPSIGSGLQPMQTSTHEYFVDNKNPEDGYSYDWGLFENNNGSPGAKVNSSLYTITNINAAYTKITFTALSTGNYILSVIKTKGGTTCVNRKTLPITVQSNSSFDVVLDNLGDQCQAPSAGLTTISWNVTFPNVITEPFEFSYSIKLGGDVVVTGNVPNITYAGVIPTPGLSVGAQASKSANSTVVVLNYSLYGVSGDDLARTVEVEINATDIYQVSEPNTTNNKDDLKINQVPVINFE